MADWPDMVLIVWEDAAILRNAVVWRSFEGLREEAKYHFSKHLTVGYLIDDTDDYYLVSHSINEMGATTDGILIPKRAVINITKSPIKKEDEVEGE